MQHSYAKGHHLWQEICICAGLLLVAANTFAVLTPYLSGPIWHPAWIVIGVMCVFLGSLAWFGMRRDAQENA